MEKILSAYCPESTRNFSSIVDLLRARALQQPDRVAYTFLSDPDTREFNVTYEELDQKARAIGARLQSLGMTGNTALLVYPPGLDFIAAFLGCLYGGVVAVPTYPPGPNRSRGSMSRFCAIAKDARPAAALTLSSFIAASENHFVQESALQAMAWLITDDLAGGWADEWQDPSAGEDTLAFLQYTSGSTSAPKGVMVSHGNLLHNELVIQQACGHTEESTFVGWLPLYHDMGLIGNVLQPLYVGSRCVLMSPASFLQNPCLWLESIARYKAKTSGAPNFAYDLCVRKIGPERRLNLDLSSWSIAFNGAEPVREETIDQFVKAFGPCGFRREVFYPCYGLAETTLIVTGGLNARPPIVRKVQAAALEKNRAIDAISNDGKHRSLVGCGRPLLDQTVIIVKPDSLRKCLPDEVGEIWVSGPSVAQGYWNRPEETELTFHARLPGADQRSFLRTGDLGFFHQGELFVTGRLKDLIIIRGRNFYPQDIEYTVEGCHPALRPGCGAAFSIDVADQERLVVVHELQHQYQGSNTDEVIRAIRQAVAEHCELQVYGVALLRAGSIPKTSSGKIQRHACREGFLAGTLEAITRSTFDDSTSAYLTGCENELGPETLARLDAYECYARLSSYLKAQLSDLLKIDLSQIDSQTPLTAFGIDSLMAIDLKHRIESNLGVVSPIGDFLQGLNINQIARHMVEQLASEVVPAPLPVAVEKGGSQYPLSYGQRALWFLHKLAPESRAYNIACAIRIYGRLDPSLLRRAVETLAHRHASVRTTFTVINGQPFQIVHDHLEVGFQAEDASAWSEDLLSERVIDEGNRRFDLETGPLLVISVFSRSAEEHVLVLVAHHIIADFWSFTILLDQLWKAYTAREHVDRPDAAPALQYTDYVRWQAEVLAGPQGERLKQYWQEKLSGEIENLQPPADYPRPEIQTYQGASQYFALTPELTGELKKLGQEHGATLHMTLMAAFQALLYRYSNQKTILVGSSTTGRDRAKLAGMIGYFVNQVVVRGDFTAGLAFDEFLSQVRGTVLEAFAHQDYPFSLLVEQLQSGRDPRYSPLAQVMFVLQKAPPVNGQDLTAFALGRPGHRIHLEPLILESMNLEQRTAQFDLTLMMGDLDEGLAGSLNYNTDLFEAGTIDRILNHLRRLLEAVVADPRRLVSDLELLSEAERHQLLVEWNETRAGYTDGMRVHELFDEQAKRTQDAVAVVFKTQRLSYREINARANQLANYLRAKGVGPEALVGLMMERSVEMVVGLLGILKASGAYVPFDPSSPQERLSFMLEDTSVKVVLTRETMLSKLSRCGAEVICLDNQWPDIASSSEDSPASAVDGDNTAYVIYTSGSTGKPKGVLIPHRGLTNYLNWCAKAYSIGEGQSVPLHSSISFDLSITSIFPPLLAGKSLVVLPEDEGADALAAHLRGGAEFGIIKITPSHLEILNSQLSQQKLVGRTGSLIIGGERLSYGSIEFWQANHPETRLINEYGPTEAVVGCSTFEVTRGWHRPGPVPIGKPIDNAQMYILDEQMRPAPIGVTAELYIGGDGLARGYLNRPELTAAQFIPHPYSAQPGARLYRTGDRARYLSDGNIEYLGRIDQQVKIRGYRVELGEIEEVLRGHEAIRECVVLLREDAPGEQCLDAYVAADKGAAPTAGQLREFLRLRLPEHMVPSAFVIMEQLPRTPGGKLIRQGLPSPERVRPELETAFAAPRTGLEERLAQIWSEVLDINLIGIHDNFFDLGGHSLKIIEVTSRVQSIYGVELPMHTFFRSPTVASLAQSIQQLRMEEEKVDGLEELLEMVDSLSEAELKALIEGETEPQASASPPELRLNHTAASVAGSDYEPEPATGRADCYRCIDIEKFPVGNDSHLVYSRVNRKAYILDSELVGLAEHCRTFKTLSEHAAEYASDLRMGRESIEKITGRLAELAGAGLMVSDKDIAGIIACSSNDGANDKSDKSEQVKIRSLVCPTCDRPGALQRCLTSHVVNSKQYGRDNDYVVMDDSKSPASRKAYQAMLKSLKFDYGVDIYYAGLEQKALFAKRLIDAKGLPPETVKFVLFGLESGGMPTFGANRNSILLSTVGDAILSVDDDIVCDIAIGPEKNNAVKFISGDVPAEDIWLFSDHQTAFQSVGYIKADIFALHEQLLGKELSSCAAGFDRVDCDKASSNLFRDLKRGTGRVLVTMNGLVGDCGWGFPAHIFLKGRSLERLIQSESDYRQGCTSREMLRVAGSTTIADRSYLLMAGAFGLDNRDLIPPFLPVGRGEDHLFGNTISSCLPRSYFAYIPYLMRHKAIEARAFWPREVFRKSSGIDLFTLFESLIGSFSPEPYTGDRRQGLYRMGKYLQEIGALRSDDFEEFVRIQVWRKISRDILDLEERLNVYGAASPYWSADVDQFLDSLRKAATEEQFYVPLELVYGRNFDDAREINQQLVLRFGQLLHTWPDIVDAARELRDQEHGLAQPV
ncbi:MAG: amino acid adenylation domain-containing protein [Blastocatellia bacterium]